MSDWADLVSAALVGTDRRATPDLLDRAAVETVRRRAGAAVRLAPAVPAVPAGHEPAVAAGEHLARILTGEHPRMLPEWLRTAAAHHRRVPPEFIPDLLDIGARDRSLRQVIAAVTGRRGRYLAGLNPAWAYLADEGTGRWAGDERTWELGESGDRRAFLERLREREPERARQLLEDTWAQEPPGNRAAFVRTLATGLSKGDEPLLERALDDRRKEVREVAAMLLARLEGSALGERMAARALPCLSAGPGRLVAEPPAECDTGMERDGVVKRPPSGIGPRAWWLRQLLARAPLRIWIGRLGATAEEIVGKEAGEWTETVRGGWIRGSVLQRDPAWARALLAVEPSGDLLAVLDPIERSSYAARIVAAARLDGALITLLGGVPGPWNGPLADAVLAKLTTGPSVFYRDELARYTAERLDPGLADDVPDDELAGALRFRRDMLRELAP